METARGKAQNDVEQLAAHLEDARSEMHAQHTTHAAVALQVYLAHNKTAPPSTTTIGT